MAIKKVTINGSDLFELESLGEKQICTIENVGKNEYYVYNDKGEGYCIANLDTVDIVELMTTGTVTHDINTTIKPYTL